MQTPAAILSYPHLFTRQKAMNPGDKEKYGAAFVFTTEEQKSPLFVELKKEALRVGIEKFGVKFESLVLEGKLKWPFKKAGPDEVAKGYPEGAVYLNARSDNQPGIVAREADPATKKARIITDPKEIYAGCIVRAALSAFAYDKSVNRGVAFGLQTLQKLADGPRLDGRKNAEDEFDADLSAAPVDITGLV